MICIVLLTGTLGYAGYHFNIEDLFREFMKQGEVHLLPAVLLVIKLVRDFTRLKGG